MRKGKEHTSCALLSLLGFREWIQFHTIIATFLYLDVTSDHFSPHNLRFSSFLPAHLFFLFVQPLKVEEPGTQSSPPESASFDRLEVAVVPRRRAWEYSTVTRRSIEGAG
jgi:hypothetical protein